MPNLEEIGKGWLKLWRKGEETKAFYHPGVWRLWTHCLMKANYKKKKFVVEGLLKPVLVKPGQFITGRFELAEELGYSKKKAITVWSWMKKLEKWGNLIIKSHNKFSLITIVNWKFYQGEDINLNTNLNNKISKEKNVKKKENAKSTSQELPEEATKEIDNLITLYKEKFAGHIKRWGMSSIFKMRNQIEGAYLEKVSLEDIKERIETAESGTPWEILSDKWIKNYRKEKKRHERLRKLYSGEES